VLEDVEATGVPDAVDRMEEALLRLEESATDEPG
jgi:hypothetical protein